MQKALRHILILMTVSSLTACKKDFLKTRPTNAVSSTRVFETTKNARMAINGLAKIMTIQYLGTQGMNGEGTIKMWYGNYPGNNFAVNLSGWANVINGNHRSNNASQYDYYPWYYYYKLVGNANSIIAHIDDAEGPEAEKAFIKAQALTYRAYSFFMLSQLYSYRWLDSGNGVSRGIVLRIDESTGDQPLASLLETYNQVYADLDEAIRLYTVAGLSRTANYEVDANVAYAIYARAALTRQDYATAESYAVKARAGYPLMTATEYNAGFCNPNREWIWSSYGAVDETLHFYSYFAYIAYNSSAGNVRTNPKCISRELYNKIPATDIRRSLFLNPTGYTYTTSTGNAATGTPLYDSAYVWRPNLASGATVYAYMQYKIAANDMPGVGHLNHFRSSEMYLIEAEAKYRQGKPANEVQDLLVALTATSGRDASYTCTKTGTDLLNEIKTYRNIELWGEGFDWFDMKRWGDPIVRNTYANGGNYIASLAITSQPDAVNKWTWVIPAKEIDYNTEAN